MERPRAFDPTECKHANRHLTGTDNPQLNAFDHSTSFAFFAQDIQKQNLLEKLNNGLSGVLIFQLLLLCFCLDNKFSTCLDCMF